MKFLWQVFFLAAWLVGGSVGWGGERARDLGVPFEGKAGEWNAITDVEGVWVGHATLVRGEGRLVVGEGPVRTGVTAILPRGKRYEPVFAGVARLNGNGEMTGTVWLQESGLLEEPILLSNTHSVGAVHEGVIAWRAEHGYHNSEEKYGFASLPVVAETWDGRLNDIHGFHVRREHVFEALNTARTGPVAEGNVGGGTGMVAFRFKSGIGTASRVVEGGYTVGVLVQSNFGLREELVIAGRPIGRMLLEERLPEMHGTTPPEGNSLIAVIATNAPLLPHQLNRVAQRAAVGMGRVGGIGHNSSGDLFLAFSTQRVALEDSGEVVPVRMLRNEEMDRVFRGTVQATEEAIVNALVAAETMEGINGNRVHGLPREAVREVFEGKGALDGDRKGVVEVGNGQEVAPVVKGER